MSIVNALTKEEHPTQAIADLITIQQEFGGFAGRHVMYVGAFNNTSSSLLLACSKMSDLTITFVTPEPFAPDAATMQQARSNAAKSGARIECLYDADGLPDAVDVVYTARWQSMGNEPNDPRWRSYLEPRRVTPEFMRRVGKDTCIFMHDLPASRGDEVSSEVMEAPYSRIWRQSAHKATAAMVVLQQLIGN
jgi:ornithine carbamoyltransferase